MLKKVRSAKGFTLIELMIVIAIIGILAAIAIPMYRAQTCKARLTEVTNAMSHIASKIGQYVNENGQWPSNTLTTANGAIYNTLGVGVDESRATYSIAFSNAGNTIANNDTATITATIGTVRGCPSSVNGSNIVLTATYTENATTGKPDFTLAWSGSVPSTYIPKR